MNVNCSKELLLNNISIVSKAVSSKTTLPILECILLKADTKGFRLIANNLELGIETSNIEAQINEVGSIALEAKIFSEIIRNLPENDISIISDEKNTTIIKSGKSEFTILGQQGDEFPLLPDVEKNNKYEINSHTLKNMIRQTIFSVAVEETKPILTGELIEIKENKLNIVAIDGFRVSFRKTDIDLIEDEISVVIPSKTLNEVSKILSDKEENIINLYFTDKHALFELENCTIVSRLLEGEFLKYEQLFTDDFTTSTEINRHEFLKSLERASLISKETKKNPVKLDIKDNKMIITSNTELGQSYEEIDADIDGEFLEIAFNPKYLIDALKAIDDDIIYIQFLTPLSPCIIKGKENDSYKYLILPLRLKN